MARHRPNPRLVKAHRSYTAEEAARTLGTHKNTIRAWIKKGLPSIDGRRPLLVHGADLREFLEVRRKRWRLKLEPGELYCTKCRAGKQPAGGIADYLPISDATGNLQGICPDCETLANRIVSRANVDAMRGKLDIAFPRGGEHIKD